MRSSSLIALLTAVVADAQIWTQLPDFPGTARDDAAAFSIGGVVYVGTGMEVGWALTDDWYAFETGSLQWTQIASLPATPRQYCTSFTVGGIGYLFGGLDANGALNELWAYDPDADTWTQKASLPGEGRYACASFQCAGRGYVATGMLQSGQPTSEVWAYDPAMNSWASRAPIPGVPRHRASTFTSWGDTTFVVGGADASFNALADGWKYDQGNDAWIAIAPLPFAAYGSDGGCPGFTGMVIGGEADGQILAEVQQYEPYGDYWSAYDAPLGTRRGGVSSSNGAVFYGLGIDSGMVRRKDWYMITWPFSIPEHDTERLLAVPDPGSSDLSLSGIGGRLRITISDAMGKQVLSDVRQGPTQIDAAAWQSGLYLVRVVDDGGTMHHARWIKR